LLNEPFTNPAICEEKRPCIEIINRPLPVTIFVATKNFVFAYPAFPDEKIPIGYREPYSPDLSPRNIILKGGDGGLQKITG